MGEGIKLPVINGLGRTDRIDNWWAQPFWMGLALTAALIYTAWRLILFPESIDYEFEGSKVVSPIFSPNILEWELFGLKEWGENDAPSWVNAAILVLWIPFGFREPATTCAVSIIGRSSNHRQVAGSMSQTSTRRLVTVAKSACSSSTIFTATSSMRP